MNRAIALVSLLAVAPPAAASSQVPLPPLPDSSGWGVHVLAAAHDSSGTLWVGTSVGNLHRLRTGTGSGVLTP